MFTLNTLEFLQSDAAQSVLTALQSQPLNEHNHLSVATQLRKRFTTEQTSALVETMRLRQKAVAKFGDLAAKLYLTSDALEQASDPLVVRYCRQMVSAHVLDLCCGIGTDSIGLARQGRQVTGVDLDPVRVAMAQLNAQAAGVEAVFEVGDVAHEIVTPGGIFFDPGRRSDGRRLYHVEQYQPPLSVTKSWQASEVVVKLSPGVDVDEVLPYGGHLTFVSVQGELKEALLRIEPSIAQTREAVVINGERVERYVALAMLPERDIRPPLAFLIEPDPAIIRAGLVRDLAYHVDAFQMDEHIAYLTSEQPIQHPALRTWAVQAWMPFHVKRLRAYLQAHNIGRVTVKKRASAITPEALIAQLKPRGSNGCVIVLTRHLDEPIAIICTEK